MLKSLERRQLNTKRTLATLVICTLLSSLLSGATSVLAQGESKNLNYSLKTTVTYVNPDEGTGTWNLTEEDRTIGLFMNNSWQSVELKEATFSLESLKEDEDGNSIAVLEFPKQQLLPGESLSYTTEYSIVSKPRTIADISEDESGTLDDIPPDLKENYTSGEGPWMINEPALVKLADELGGSETNVLKLVKGFVSWIWENIQRTQAHELPFYPNETLNAREGDCDDQAILLVTLCRIMGIPSHVQMGAIYMPDSEKVEASLWENHLRAVEKKIGWHGWAMLYIPPWGWLPADLTYVPSTFDPLDAIRYGAVVSQDTIQYMNCSKIDYVAPSRQARTLLLENDFVVRMEDEMTEIEQGDATGLNPAVVVGFILLSVMITVSSFLTARRWRRLREKEEFAADSEVTGRAQT